MQMLQCGMALPAVVSGPVRPYLTTTERLQKNSNGASGARTKGPKQ
jgi:hypothetical protein